MSIEMKKAIRRTGSALVAGSVLFVSLVSAPLSVFAQAPATGGAPAASPAAPAAAPAAAKKAEAKPAAKK